MIDPVNIQSFEQALNLIVDTLNQLKGLVPPQSGDDRAAEAWFREFHHIMATLTAVPGPDDLTRFSEEVDWAITKVDGKAEQALELVTQREDPDPMLQRTDPLPVLGPEAIGSGMMLWFNEEQPDTVFGVTTGWTIANGDTVNSFETPDFRGRFLVCSEAAGFGPTGLTGGAKVHYHQQYPGNPVSGYADGAYWGVVPGISDVPCDVAGSILPYDGAQPFIVINVIVWVGFPA